MSTLPSLVSLSLFVFLSWRPIRNSPVLYNFSLALTPPLEVLLTPPLEVLLIPPLEVFLQSALMMP